MAKLAAKSGGPARRDEPSKPTRKPKPPDENSGRDRRLATSGQWRRAYSGAHDGGCARTGRGVRFPHAAGFLDLPAADLSRHPRRGARRRARSAAGSKPPAPTMFISRPRARSAGPRDTIACSAGACSRRATTRAFPNISPPARSFPRAGPMRRCGAFTRRPPRHGADALDPRRTRPSRLPARVSLDARRRPHVCSARSAPMRPGSAASDLSERRARRGRKEPRSPADASTCPAPPSSSATVPRAPAGAPLPQGAFSRRRDSARRSREHLCERGCFRLSLAHRHVRDRPDRSDGERPARRRLSGHRPARRRRR